MHNKSQNLLKLVASFLVAAVAIGSLAVIMTWNNPHQVEKLIHNDSELLETFSFAQQIAEDSQRRNLQSFSRVNRRVDQNTPTEDVDWANLVQKSASVGIQHSWSTNKFNSMEWALFSYNQTEVPKIIGVVFWFDHMKIFRGLQPIYKDRSVQEQKPLEQRVPLRKEQQGRITFMFADDEYITDIQGKKLGNWIRDVAVVTNRGIYENPGNRGVGTFSFKPTSNSWMSNIAFVGFGSQFNRAHFHFLEGYYIDLNQISQQQKENYFLPDEINGSNDYAYETWSCEPRSSAEVNWGKKNRIDHICDAARDDPRVQWTEMVTKVGTPMSTTGEDFVAHGNLDHITKWTSWHDVPQIVGFTIYKKEGNIFGMGVDYSNGKTEVAKNCKVCDEHYTQLDNDEYITNIGIVGDEYRGISRLEIVTNKQLFRDFSKFGTGNQVYILDLGSSDRVVGFEVIVKQICVETQLVAGDLYQHQNTGDIGRDAASVSMDFALEFLEQEYELCQTLNTYAISAYKVNLNDLHESQVRKFNYSPFDDVNF